MSRKRTWAVLALSLLALLPGCASRAATAGGKRRAREEKNEGGFGHEAPHRPKSKIRRSVGPKTQVIRSPIVLAQMLARCAGT